MRPVTIAQVLHKHLQFVLFTVLGVESRHLEKHRLEGECAILRTILDQRCSNPSKGLRYSFPSGEPGSPFHGFCQAIAFRKIDAGGRNVLAEGMLRPFFEFAIA